MRRARFAPGSYELVRGIANQVKTTYLLDSLDFVYFDARKDYAGAKEDLMDWFARLRPGGVLAGHARRITDIVCIHRAVDANATTRYGQI